MSPISFAIASIIERSVFLSEFDLSLVSSTVLEAISFVFLDNSEILSSLSTVFLDDSNIFSERSVSFSTHEAIISMLFEQIIFDIADTILHMHSHFVPLGLGFVSSLDLRTV